MLLIPSVEAALRRQWCRLLTIYFREVFITSRRKVCLVLSVSGIFSNTWSLLSYRTVLPREKYSKFIHVISGDWGLLCMKQPLSNCYCEAIFEPTKVHQKLICCTKCCFHSWFYILGIFFKLPFIMIIIKLCILTMRSSVQKFKNCKKVIWI